MNLNEDIKNCTTIFLLPGIGLYRKDILKYGFLAAYLDDKHHEIHYKDSIYLLYHPENMSIFQELLEKEHSRTTLLLEDYDYPGGYVVTVYKFPEKFGREYRLFLEGKYSKFSDEYKKLFPEMVTVNGVERFSLPFHVFIRSEAIKKFWEEKVGEKLPDDAELWSSPTMEKEILDIDNIK